MPASDIKPDKIVVHRSSGKLSGIVNIEKMLNEIGETSQIQTEIERANMDLSLSLITETMNNNFNKIDIKSQEAEFDLLKKLEEEEDFLLYTPKTLANDPTSKYNKDFFMYNTLDFQPNTEVRPLEVNTNLREKLGRTSSKIMQLNTDREEPNKKNFLKLNMQKIKRIDEAREKTKMEEAISSRRKANDKLVDKKLDAKKKEQMHQISAILLEMRGSYKLMFRDLKEQA